MLSNLVDAPLEKYHLMYYVPVVTKTSEEDEEVFEVDKPDVNAMLHVLNERKHPLVLFFGLVAIEEIDDLLRRVTDMQCREKLAVIIDSEMPEIGASSPEQVSILRQVIEQHSWVRIWEVRQLTSVISYIPIDRFLGSHE